MNRLYADDLTGTNPANIAEGQLSTATYPNKFNLVVPPSAPFYRNGMVVTDLDGNPLFEGIDYYLALYYADGAAASRAAVFGGLMLINHTDVKYKVQAFGSAYSVPETEIGMFLVNPNLTEPRNLDWSTLLRWKIPVPEMGAPGDFEEAVETDKIIAAVMQLRDLIGDNGEALDAALDNVITELTNVALRIHEDDLYQHHKTPHQHKYTPEMIGALRADGTAVNAIKIFGRTLAELSAILVQSHVSQAVIDRLYDKAGGYLNGRLHVNGAGELVFISSSGKQSFRANGQNIVIATDSADLRYIADRAKNAQGKAIELNAGYNGLLIPSDGAGNTLRPIYNGAFVITEDTTDLYLWAPSTTRANPTFTTTDTLKASGAATQGSPLTFDATPPQASDTKLGLFRLTSSLLLTSPGYALTQKAVTDLRDKLDAYVGESFTVNGEAFGSDQSIELDKSDIGLGNVNNTTYQNKPVHQRFRDALLNKALKTHTHTSADLQNVPTASPVVSGLTMLSNLLTDTTASAAVPKLLNDISLKTAEAEDRAKNIIPGWVATGTYYGDSGFLPIPTAGQYNGFAQAQAAQQAVIAGEEDSRLYVLRSATDGYAESDKVLYWVADMDSNGKLSNPMPTTVEYYPEGLKRLYPGVKFRSIRVIGDEAGIFLGDDGNHYLVLFDGTMNMAKHVRVSKVTLEDVTKGANMTVNTFYPSQDRIVLTAGKVCLIKSVLSNEDFYAYLWVGLQSDVGKGTIVLSKKTLSGKYQAGDAVRFVTYGTNSEDPNTTNLWYYTAAGKAKWTTPSVVTYTRRNIFAGAEGSKIRVRLHPRARPTGPTASIIGPGWTVSYVVDIETGVATLDNDFFPLCLDETGLTFPNGEYVASANNILYGATSASVFMSPTGRVTVIGAADTDDNIYRFKPAQSNRFAAARWDVDWSPVVSTTMPLLGPYGSLYVYRERGPVFVSSDAQVAYFRERGTATCIRVAYDKSKTYGIPGYGGWGASNDRTVVTQARYEELCRLGYVWDGTKAYLNGTSFDKAESRQYRTVGQTETIAADTVTINAARWAQIVAYVAQQVPKWADTADANKALWVSVMDVGGANLAIVTAVTLVPRTTGSGSTVSTYVYRLPMTVASGNLNIVTSGAVEIFAEQGTDFGALSIQSLAESTQMRLIKRSDGWVIKTRTIGRVNSTGTNRDLYVVLKAVGDFASWGAGKLYNFYIGGGESDLVHMPDTNEIVQAGFINTGIYYGGKAYSGNSYNYDAGASRDVILFAPQVAEGRILYITQDVFFFAEEKEYMAPKTQFTLAPNTTTHLHVYLNNGQAAYKSGAVIEPDTDTQLYIGYVVTDATSIVETKVDRAVSLEGISALMQHASNPYAHDYMPEGSDVETIFDVMQNKPLFKEQGVRAVSMANMFNDFVKFSHLVTSETQPGVPAEVNSWTLPDDYFYCTANTTSFSGRLSNYMCGDYDMSFFVTGTEAATDNDAAAIVIAAFAKGDIDEREHTLSVVFSGSIEAHMVMVGRVELYQDYQTPWAKRLAVINADTSSVTWATLYQHVVVQRRGTEYAIGIKSAVQAPTGDRLAFIRKLRQTHSEVGIGETFGDSAYKTLSFDAADIAPDFAVAKTRWGFGAFSQPFIQIWPIEEPARILEDYYADSASTHDVLLNTNFGKSEILTSVIANLSEPQWYMVKPYTFWLPVVAGTAAQSNNVVNAGAPSYAIAIMPPGNDKARKANRFALSASFQSQVAGNVEMNISGYVDDLAVIIVNGVTIGNPTGAFSINFTAALVSGENHLAFIVSETPDMTPSYIGWGLKTTSDSKVVSNSSLDERFAWVKADGSIDGPVNERTLSIYGYNSSGGCEATFVNRNKIKDASLYCIPQKMIIGTPSPDERSGRRLDAMKYPRYVGEDPVQMGIIFDKFLRRH